MLALINIYSPTDLKTGFQIRFHFCTQVNSFSPEPEGKQSTGDQQQSG